MGNGRRIETDGGGESGEEVPDGLAQRLQHPFSAQLSTGLEWEGLSELFSLTQDMSGWLMYHPRYWQPIWVFKRFNIPVLGPFTLDVVEKLWKVSLALACAGLFTRTSMSRPRTLSRSSAARSAFRWSLPISLIEGIRMLMGPTFEQFLVVKSFWVPWDRVLARMRSTASGRALVDRSGAAAHHAGAGPASGLV